MSDPISKPFGPALSDVSEDVRALVDGYFADTLEAAQLEQLELLLQADPTARRYFLRFGELDRDLRVEAHARRQGEAVLARIGIESGEPSVSSASPTVSRLRIRPMRWVAAAASVLLALGAGWWAARSFSARSVPVAQVEPPVLLDIAAIVNAQNCKWKDDAAPPALVAGAALEIERGLVELKFRSGAEIVLEGPAKLELLTANSARLLRGRLTGKVTGPVKGFEVFSPGGRVVDLGTEFGVNVPDGGATEVYVFNGRVQAFGRNNTGLDLVGTQSARMDDAGVVLKSSSDPDLFVREIVAPPVIEPRTLRLNFGKGYDGTLADAQGLGTGLTHRLPGTGDALEPNDSNLVVNAVDGQLELTTTNSDINGQRGMPTGEYLGTRLAELGFTGSEDFEVEVFLPNIPALQDIGQFGLYAGSKSDKVIRGGLISRGKEGPYTIFMTNNAEGRDHDSHFLGLFSMGDDLRIRLKRTNGKYAMTVENMTTGSASTLSIRHPAYLDAENDLYVGLFGANTASEVRRTLVVKEFSVTVWTKEGQRRDAVAMTP